MRSPGFRPVGPGPDDDSPRLIGTTGPHSGTCAHTIFMLQVEGDHQECSSLIRWGMVRMTTTRCPACSSDSMVCASAVAQTSSLLCGSRAISPPARFGGTRESPIASFAADMMTVGGGLFLQPLD